MRTPVIAGNWKLFKNLSETRELLQELAPRVAGVSGVEIIVAPVFTALTTAVQAAMGTTIRVAAQDCFWEEEGAFTGEVAPGLLKDAGCSHVIIGHSERRQYFGETDATVNRKIKAACAAGLTVLFCVGETLAEREAGTTFTVIETQLRTGLAGVTAADLQRLIIAYEPVWAIGTGKTASNEQAQEVHARIRTLLVSLYDQAAADALRILYGGSVKPENIRGLMGQQDIDGALVGGASLKADSFAAIVRFQETE
ncbi:triose-phosphate isomerase [Trichlorobacter ammonificans]|uniref:Triosephosphate isomerase n=1 Tax=Trichlorobacter ammonificans TaxID=2916410 RepID=A0ABM9D6Q6_9BACT|nr:triose-phosphate isomerase [Trichlorobacter ammonificans]CAH2030673.1 Triosephosphate isomerase [Trichlorobacter ammonificans]